jgi:hypothetical protein
MGKEISGELGTLLQFLEDFRCLNINLFTAKPQRSQRGLVLFNPMRGGIGQTSSGLRPNNYPQGSECY